MTGADIALLFARIGPLAAQLLLDLVGVWNREMTPEELKAFCLRFRKSEEDYVAAEIARRNPVPPPPPVP